VKYYFNLKQLILIYFKLQLIPQIAKLITASVSQDPNFSVAVYQCLFGHKTQLKNSLICIFLIVMIPFRFLFLFFDLEMSKWVKRQYKVMFKKMHILINIHERGLWLALKIKPCLLNFFQ